MTQIRARQSAKVDPRGGMRDRLCTVRSRARMCVCATVKTRIVGRQSVTHTYTDTRVTRHTRTEPSRLLVFVDQYATLVEAR